MFFAIVHDNDGELLDSSIKSEMGYIDIALL